MNTSSKVLWDCYDGKCELTPSVVVDLFGMHDWTDEMKQNTDKTITTFDGLYKGLYLMDVSWVSVHRNFQNGTLDDLIHTTYSQRKSGYYQDFCNLNFVIQKNKKMNKKK